MKKTNLKSKGTLKTKGKKRPKVKTIAKHIKETATIFSKYIRLRDSEPNSKGEWWGECISCLRPYMVYDGKWNRQVNAGHFVSRTQQIITFDEENVNLQCVRCNKHLSGNLLQYEINLDKKYGDDTGQRLRELAKKNLDFQWKIDDLLMIQEDCKTATDYMLTH